MSEYLVMRADERAAYEAELARNGRDLRPGSVGQRAFILGWRRAKGTTAPKLMWPPVALSLKVRLDRAGISRSEIDCDNAIQSAVETLAADDPPARDPYSDRHWDVLEPHVLRFLDLTDDELAAVA